MCEFAARVRSSVDFPPDMQKKIRAMCYAQKIGKIVQFLNPMNGEDGDREFV